MKRRIFISSPRDTYLDDSRKILKWAIIGEIENLGYEVQVFNPEDGGRGLAAGISWSTREVEKIMRRCVGAAVIGFPFWNDCSQINKKDDLQRTSLVTEYCQYEGAIALTYNCPILGILEENVEKRLIFSSHGGDAIFLLPRNAGKKWIKTPDFQNFLATWNNRVKKRSDLFLGYSSKSVEIAKKIKLYLEEQFPDLKLLDWNDGFLLGDTIINQIQEATNNCTGAIFLFTNDGELSEYNEVREQTTKMITRDNVIFEAGFFAHAKGTQRVHIISEKGSKIPADLGGVIYSFLQNRNDISSIYEKLKEFIDNNL